MARKRSSVRRGSGSAQRSSVSSRSATCAATAPSGWPDRGSPHWSPRWSTGSSASCRSSSFSGWKAAATPPVLVDPLCDPTLVLAGEGHLDVVLTHREELGTVLGHARAVVDQDQVKVVGR